MALPRLPEAQNGQQRRREGPPGPLARKNDRTRSNTCPLLNSLAAQQVAWANCSDPSDMCEQLGGLEDSAGTEVEVDSLGVAPESAGAVQLPQMDHEIGDESGPPLDWRRPRRRLQGWEWWPISMLLSHGARWAAYRISRTLV